MKKKHRAGYRKHKAKVLRVLRDCHFPNSYWETTHVGPTLYFRQVFWAPDSKTHQITRFTSRWWMIGYGVTRSEIVRSAFCAAKWTVEHELMENFLYKGKRIFNPHKKVKA